MFERIRNHWLPWLLCRFFLCLAGLLMLLVLALLALGLGVLWWVRRGEDYGTKKLSWLKGLKARRLTLNQGCAMGLTCLGFLGVVVLLLYFFVDSDDKRIRRAIKEMAAGV